MRTCRSCQAELDQQSLAAARCQKCGTPIANVAQRTVQDLRPRGGPDTGQQTEESIELELAGEGDDGTVDGAGATMEVPSDASQQGKSPTVADAGNMTIDLWAAAPGGPTIESSGAKSNKPPTIPDTGDLTVDLSALPPDAGHPPTVPNPTRRSTHTVERDMTVDYDSSEDLARLSSQWEGKFDSASRQNQTIRQKETVGGSFRSSLPVKSRYVRDPKTRLPSPRDTLEDIPDYELLEQIGEGGMGVVYAAHQSSIARTVAIKMLKPSKKIGEEQRDKFISEAVVTGELDHPNIVPIYDLGANDEGALFYSMKRVRGTPWDDILDQKSLTENLTILLRAADAVAFAHAHGVVHRDLKPENVMLGDYGEVLVMDWGLARVTSQFANANAIYQADSLGGTPAYMAPEMARGPVEEIDQRSDVYLLGAILYEIIGGKPPHAGRDVMQCLMAAAQNTIQPIDHEGELKDIALKAMARNKEERYQTVKEFQDAVRLYQSHSESIMLASNAERYLDEARATGEYKSFARAAYGFQESLDLWAGNERARLLLTETEHDYANCAFDKGDFDLAASLLKSDIPQHAVLLDKVEYARQERDARQRMLRNFRRLAAALVLAVIATITIAFFSVRAQRNRAIEARQEALAQKEIADQERQTAEQQRQIAMTERQRAEVAREAAVEQKQIADQQRQTAVEQREIADTQRQRAVLAKEAEEYEAYVANIGLAAAKIDENAYDFALALLRGCDPHRRHWEWGRLAHLCQLNTRAFLCEAPVDAVAYAPDGVHFISGDWDGTAAIRNTITREVEHSFRHGQYVHSVAYSPDGRRVATGSSDHKIRILDATEGTLLRTLEGHTDAVLSVRFSPDGQQLVSSGYDNTARLWDVASGQSLQEFEGHGWWVWAAEFSPDGRRIVTVSQDGKAIVWQRGGDERLAAPRARRRPSRVAATSRSAPAQDPTQERRDSGRYEKLVEFVGHNGAVYAAAFSPDGRRIATGGYDNKVMIWDPDEVQPIDIERRLEGLPDPPSPHVELSGHDGPVRTVAFSPHNERLLISGSHDNSIRLWDTYTAKLVKTLRGHGGRVRSCVFSGDGDWILSGGHDSYVRQWHIEGYEEVRVLRGKVLEGHRDAVLSAAFSPDGEQVVTASRDRTASLWDTTSGQRLAEFDEGHEFLTTTAVFFDEGRRLATGAGDNSVRIWDVATGTELFELMPTGRAGTLAAAPDGRWLVTGGPAHRAQLWDARSGRQLDVLEAHEAEVTAAAVAPDGQTIATGDDDGRLRLWRRDGDGQWRVAARLEGHTRTITAARFLDGGSRLITASGDNTCAQWNVETGEEIRRLSLKHPRWVNSLDVSDDGRHALTACDDGIVRVWSLADARQLAQLETPGVIYNWASFAADDRSALVTASTEKLVQRWAFNPPAARPETVLDFAERGRLVWAAFVSPSGRLLTIGGNDARLWNKETLAEEVRFSPHGAVASAAVSPDGRLVVTGSWDNSAKIWDVASGRAIRKLVGAHQGYINSVSFSPDGQTVLTASDDGTARLWDVASGRPLEVVFRGHRGAVHQAVFSADGTRVITGGSDKTARVWDAATGEQLATLEGHDYAVLCVGFSTDGGRAITGSRDNLAKVWNLETGEQVATLEGHTASITSVAFSPDGRRALTGSQDNTAKLWDPATGKEILSLTGHDQEVTSVAFSPNGLNALSGSRDGTAILWLSLDWRDDEATKTALGR